MRLYLPEVFAVGALCLFYSDRPMSASIFLVLSVFFALGHLGLYSQSQKVQQERFEKVFGALGVVGMVLGSFLENIAITASHHSSQDDEDDINYN
jgi:nitrate/nitrite transporter NarK